jgi:hypothetical protein
MPGAWSSVRPAEGTRDYCRYCDTLVIWTGQWGGFWLAPAGTSNTARATCPKRPGGWHETTTVAVW